MGVSILALLWDCIAMALGEVAWYGGVEFGSSGIET